LEFISASTNRDRGGRGAGGTNLISVPGVLDREREGEARGSGRRVGGGGGGIGIGEEEEDANEEEDRTTAEFCRMSTAATMASIGLMPSGGDEATAGSRLSPVGALPADGDDAQPDAAAGDSTLVLPSSAIPRSLCRFQHA